VPAKFDAVTANARAWCHSGVRCAAPVGRASAGSTTPLKIESGVTTGGSFARKARKATLSASHGIGNCRRPCTSGRLSSSKGQWCFGVSNASDVASAASPNFSTRDSQFSSLIKRIVGFGILNGIFGMASVDVDRRQMEVGYLVLARQLKEEHDLVYALDLFDRIDLCRTKRDLSFARGCVVQYQAWERSRNAHITTLAKLLEAKRTTHVAH